MATLLADYLLYLAFLTNKLNGFFEKQSPYIFCKKGCSKCCENGEYPFSELEYNFIMIGFSKLAPEVREEILNKVKKIKAEKEKYINAAKQLYSGKLKVESGKLEAAKQLGSEVTKLDNSKISQTQQTDKNLSTLQPFNLSTKTNFTYECPFLINHECSVYEFRGIICRSFGLMTINPDGLSKIPFCAFEGLNYSNVMEPETGIISTEKYKKLGENIPEPLAFNVGYKFLTSENIEENFKIHFGDKKALIDWF